MGELLFKSQAKLKFFVVHPEEVPEGKEEVITEETQLTAKQESEDDADEKNLVSAETNLFLRTSTNTWTPDRVSFVGCSPFFFDRKLTEVFLRSPKKPVNGVQTI